MIDSRHEHKPPVEDLRLAEIEALWEKCREEQDACVSVCYSGTYAELRKTVQEADTYLNHLLEEMVPELIASVRQRLNEDKRSKSRLG